MGGYSARYHAASLAAVFLALAIGILIGVGFGDDVVSGTTEDLEQSLQGDVEDARQQADELAAELNRERDFGETVYPDLVGGDLRGESVALIALGGLPEDVADDVQAAIEPAGARLAEVAVVREPPDVDALAGDLEGTRYARMRRRPEAVEAFGRAAGRGLVMGGGVVRRVRGQLLSRFSGRPAEVDDVVVVRDAPRSLGRREEDATDRLESGLLDGIRGTRLPSVGVERSDDPESSIQLFDSHDISTVDSVDLVSGRLAMVTVLLGAEGNFGVKEAADQLLPDLLPTSTGAAGGP
jgi:Copper transport outer membrane protein, MctB